MENQAQTILPFDGSKVYLNKISYPFEIPEQNENITFSQLLQSKDNSSIERAFLTSYIWDPKFVCKHFPGQFPLSVACHWAPPKREGKKTINVNGRDIEVIHPSFPDDIEGNVHCKLLLLFFSTSIRVIVTSANLQTRDWDALFQVVWTQDFPVKSKEAAATSEFEETLTLFVNALSAESIAALLKNYDFSDAKVKLITSVPGIHSKDNQQFGHIRLRSLLSQLDQFTEPSTLDYQTATIGAIRKDWMFSEFMQSCLGNESIESTTVNPRVLFPTHQEIVSAHYTEGGRAICCWDKSGVVKKHLFHLNSISKGVLLHSKIIQRKSASKTWTYAGSHNLSASAWGRLMNGDLYVNNYELGVLFNNNNVSITLPFGSEPAPYEGVGDKAWLIPNKPKVIISNANSITLGLFVLPQKHIFLPKAEHVKSITGATMVLPNQPCINIMRFGSCKYGDTCRYSHVYSPVELKGTAQEVFEGARLVMSLLTRNTFSMGAVITVENVVIQGWIWNITEQWRYTLFVPDPKHPLAKQFNIDVLLVNDIPVEKWLHELSWLTGAAATVVPARNYVTAVRPKKDGELPEFNNTFSINGEQTTYSKLVYIFGTKGSIKTFVSDVSILAKKPQRETEQKEEQQQEYSLKEENVV